MKEDLKKEDYDNRLQTEVVKLLKLLMIGSAYAVWCSFSKIRIPCVFRLVTHLKCPGCGMTSAMLSVIHFRFSQAFAYNKLSLTVVPVLIGVLLGQEYRYIKTSSRHTTYGETILLFYAGD